MRLHQLKVEYEPEQDRLLMLVATNEGMELRLTLTRRFVKLLWPLLVKGGDWPAERIVGARRVLARGGRVHSIPFEHERSTTALLERIRRPA